MCEVILNLDYGSYYTKAIWKFYEPGRRTCIIPPYGLSGSWSAGLLQADPSIQLGPEGSLKEAFLLNRISLLELEDYEEMVCHDLKRFLFTGVAGRIETCNPRKFRLLINIHTPLQFQDSRWVADTGVFRITDPKQQMMGPHYMSLEALRTAARQAKGGRELAWAAFLAGCLESVAIELHPESIQVAVIPESLTTVNWMVDHFESGQRRQFLMLDIGHFTTDYALAAFDNLGSDRFVVRCANSIFEAGSRFISKAGSSKWIEKILSELDNNRAAARRPLSYMDLTVVLVGGGASSLDFQVRQKLVQEVRQWACLDSCFKEGIRGEWRSVFSEEPVLPEYGLSALCDADDQSSEWTYAQLPTHIPCITACMHAEDFRNIRFKQDVHPALDPDSIGAECSERAYEEKAEYPFRENDGWFVPTPGVRCPHCKHIVKSQRDLQLHVFQAHLEGCPTILMDGDVVSDGGTLVIRRREDLDLVRLQNCSLVRFNDGTRKNQFVIIEKHQPISDLVELRDHSQVDLEAVLEGKNRSEIVTRCILKVVIFDAAEIRSIENRFRDWLQNNNRQYLIQKLVAALPGYDGRSEKEFISIILDFVLAMTMRDRAEGPGIDSESAASKLYRVIEVLGRQDSPLARVLTGIARFILVQLPDDLPTTGDPILDGALQRLKNPSNDGFVVGSSPSGIFASIIPILDQQTRFLIKAFSLPFSEIVGMAEGLCTGPFPLEQMKWNLLMASAMTEVGRLAEAQSYLNRLSLRHPEFGKWVSDCRERVRG